MIADVVAVLEQPEFSATAGFGSDALALGNVLNNIRKRGD
jgi:hypothetical protein